MTTEGSESPREVVGLDPWGLLRIERLLVELEGVNSIKLVPDGSGGIDEIHVLSSSTLGPKQIVRNVESALLAEFGLQIDHRKISIARIKTTEVPSIQSELARTAAEQASLSASAQLQVLPEKDGERVRLSDIRIERQAGRTVTSQVTLTRRGQEYVGEATGPDFDRSRLEVAGTAVLRALEQASDGSAAFALHGVTQFKSGDKQLVIVFVRGTGGRDSVSLSGVGEVHDSAEEAAVLACLAATNRWFGKHP